MNKGSIVERLCSDLDRKEPRYKSPTLLYFTLLHCLVNKKAQLMLAYPRDAKTMKKFLHFEVTV